MRGQLHRVLRTRGVLGKDIDNRARIADIDPLLKKILQYALNGREGQHLGDEVLDQLRRILRNVVEQLLSFLAAEQFRSIGKYQVIEMGSDHRARVDDRVAHDVRLVAQRCLDPNGWQAKSGILGRISRQCAADSTRIDRQEHSGIGLTTPNLDAFQGNSIGIWFEFEIVANMYWRREETDLLGELLPQAANALEQFAVLASIHQGYQAIAHLQAEHIHRSYIGPTGIKCFSGNRGRRHFHFSLAFLMLTLERPPSEATDPGCQQEEGDVGHARNQSENAENARSQHHDNGIAK